MYYSKISFVFKWKMLNLLDGEKIELEIVDLKQVLKVSGTGTPNKIKQINEKSNEYWKPECNNLGKNVVCFDWQSLCLWWTELRFSRVQN